jgi:uncharacterized membrane protein HdeD (DUF308 family)
MRTDALDSGLYELYRNCGWLAASGIALVLLGTFALIDSVAVSVFSIVLFAWVLMTAGVIQGIQAFRHRRSGHGHFLLHVLNAIFPFFIGIILLRNSLAGLLVMTLLLAVYFIVVGIFRIVAALTIHVPGSGWALVDGLVMLILGVMVWQQWPVAALWIIGLFIGINLIITGCSQSMVALAARRLSTQLA